MAAMRGGMCSWITGPDVVAAGGLPAANLFILGSVAVPRLACWSACMRPRFAHRLRTLAQTATVQNAGEGLERMERGCRSARAGRVCNACAQQGRAAGACDGGMCRYGSDAHVVAHR